MQHWHAASDEDLIRSARAGDHGAVSELWRRHYPWAVKVATRFIRSAEGEDVASEAFTRVARIVRAGGGPRGAFRPYLFTVIRHLAIEVGNADDPAPLDAAELAPDDVPDRTDAVWDRDALARAFRTLPAAWQEVLWNTEVNGIEPRELAHERGASPNAVAALAYRAREGLRRAWLRAHLSYRPESPECRWAVEQMVDAVRDRLAAPRRPRYRTHLAACEPCRTASTQLQDIARSVAGIWAPVIIGAGGAVAFVKARLAAHWAPAFAAAVAPGAAAGRVAIVGLTTALLLVGPAPIDVHDRGTAHPSTAPDAAPVAEPPADPAGPGTEATHDDPRSAESGGASAQPAADTLPVPDAPSWTPPVAEQSAVLDIVADPLDIVADLPASLPLDVVPLPPLDDVVHVEIDGGTVERILGIIP